MADTHLPKRARDLPSGLWAAVDAADLVIHAGDWVSAALLGIVTVQRRWLHIDGGFPRRMTIIAGATVLMAVAIAGLRALLPEIGGSSIRSLAILAILVLFGLSVYVGLLRVFGLIRISEIARHS